MFTPVRLALLVVGFAASAQVSAAASLSIVRGGVGLVGYAQQLSGSIDIDGNGRPELMVVRDEHVVFVEEDDGLRGYHEVARVDGSPLSYFRGAMLVNVPGAEPTLLIRWNTRIEIRDLATLTVQANLSGYYTNFPALGDVDGDGLPELVLAVGNTVRLLDPATLVPRGTVQLAVDGNITVADILGDARAEVISGDARAFTITRVGTTLSSTEVWNANIPGGWIPVAIELQGHTAIVLHYISGGSAQLATFWPKPALRPLVTSSGAGFSTLFADANGDGQVDIITAYSSIVRAMDIATGAVLWERNTVAPPSIGSVERPITIDLDGDGISELVWSDESSGYPGIVANTQPLAGPPRWRSDINQSSVVDWTVVRNAGGVPSIAYLTKATRKLPKLGTLGFLNGATFFDEAGSAFDWLPGYTGFSPTLRQNAITALARDGMSDAVIVAGTEYPQGAADPSGRFLWTFDDSGAYVGQRALLSTTTVLRIVAAQALDRPERQLVVAGALPLGSAGPWLDAMRVEVIDYDTGSVLWQSVPLPSTSSQPGGTLQVADLNGDGHPEVIFAYAGDITVLTPSTSSEVVTSYPAHQFSVLDRGVGNNAKLATVNGADIAVYDGLSTIPDKTFMLPSYSSSVALFSQPPNDVLMFATSNADLTEVRRYSDGERVAFSGQFPASTLTAMDLDGDQRIELIGYDLNVWRLEYDSVFRSGFDSPFQ